ncbi:cation:proton antiporter [Rhodococcus tukisamuensis]|uniref:Kef-type K+ transport system, membrane component KefB n=1 Tax=Rhodococcus tukisamuensis TaxID=168276 RepID=A0A1G6Z1X0_9NOCA|nr:cation:proton antiporter [Rhodococcus tukisamuensis]SDD96531.1 Kef-type K+ transport system, membrane component KefB [Rhodococcus tukisamuensis]
MSFAALAFVSLVALLGPALAARQRWHVPVVLGELLAGIVVGGSLLGILDASEPTFTMLADIGFALVMFVAGTHVPMRDATLRPALLRGTGQALLVGILAVPAGIAVAALFGTGQAGLYAVLIASSSAALVLPIVDSLGLGGSSVLRMLAQVAVADTACIVALPLVIAPDYALRAALGVVAVSVCAGLVYLLYRELERRGLGVRLHRLSEDRKLALELRMNLGILFGLAALAVWSHVSVMLAGFALGLVVAAVGEPRRLARQLFGITEGFFGPLFFVWLGASLNLRELVDHPSFVLLGLLLGFGAVAVHSALRLLGQPLALGVLAASQLGIPVAAATVGTQLGVLAPGEAPALILGALVTVGIAAVAGGVAARQGLTKT